MSSSPVVTSIDPSSGPIAGGTKLTITGTGFTGAEEVKFGTAGGTSLSVDSDTKITVKSPPRNAGIVSVRVITPAGSSSPGLKSQFTYTSSAGTGGTTGDTPTDRNAGSTVDPALSSQLVGSLLTILQTATSPDALEAQNIILRRMALEGDLINSRIPAPKNITEIGGYINLLGVLNQPEMRSQALAGILSVAGPSQPAGWISNTQALSFVNRPNDRPAGPAQPTIPLTFLVRSDFSEAIGKAIDFLHQRGCTLPIVSRSVITLPPSLPGATTPADILPYLGRTLDLVAGTALVDPQNDPLVLIRKQGSSDPFQIAANVLSPGAIAVTPANYDVLKCNATSCTPVALMNILCVPIAPVLANAGFYPASPLPQPTSLSSTAWTRFTNITGLVNGVTQLGDELSLLYNWNTIINSVFAAMLSWIWNGSQFEEKAP